MNQATNVINLISISLMMQAKGHGYRTRIDIHHWLGPQFENVTDSMPHSLSRVESKVSAFC